MSKALNPTRPTATTADVVRRLKNLSPKQRNLLVGYGYPIEELKRIAESEDQADSVDALLAIMTDRQGYVHDAGDLKKADRVAHTLKAQGPRAHLVYRKKEQPTPNAAHFDPTLVTKNPGSWTTVAATVGVILIVLSAVAAIVAFVR